MYVGARFGVRMLRCDMRHIKPAIINPHPASGVVFRWPNARSGRSS